MIALIRALLGGVSPVAWLKVASAVAMAAWLGWLALALIDHGRQSALEAQRAANAADADKADAIEREILNCPDDKWVRGVGCAK